MNKKLAGVGLAVGLIFSGAANASASILAEDGTLVPDNYYGPFTAEERVGIEIRKEKIREEAAAKKKAKAEAEKPGPFYSDKYVKFEFLVTEVTEDEIYAKEANGDKKHPNGLYVDKNEKGLKLPDVEDIEEGDIIYGVFDKDDQWDGFIGVELKWP